MELKLQNGDYVSDGAAGLRRVEGAEALLQRVLFRLTARLWQLGTIPPAGRLPAARQYVAEALAEEPVSVEHVTLTEQGSRGFLTVELRYGSTPLSVTVEVP